jgi:mRNA interferase RelE/StbE
MKYQLLISRTAEKAMLQLPNIYASKIDKAISGLAINPRPKGFKKLKGIAEL